MSKATTKDQINRILAEVTELYGRIERLEQHARVYPGGWEPHQQQYVPHVEGADKDAHMGRLVRAMMHHAEVEVVGETPEEAPCNAGVK